VDAPVDVDAPGEDAPAASVYRAAILADNPLAYWRFGEASGTTVHDETGHGHDGTIGTGVTLGAGGAILGDADTALQLAGTQGVDAGDAFDFPNNAPYSLEGWIKPDHAIDNAYRHMFTKDDQSQATGREEYGVYIHNGDGIAFER